MKLVIQRVTAGSVIVNGECVGEIGLGLVVLIGVGQGDTVSIADTMIDKLIGLRIFSDENGKMNRSLRDVGGGLLLVSQFTLYADCSRGRRPAFTSAAAPEAAKSLYDYFVWQCQNAGVPVATGIFAADMQLRIVNDGPVTILLEG